MCTDTAYGWTVVWPDMFYVLVEAELDEEIHCDDVRGIVGGCATLPRRGNSVFLMLYYTSARADPCVQPPDIVFSRDVVPCLMAVKPDGRVGGPGVWRLRIKAQTRAVPARSCNPQTETGLNARIAGTASAPDTTTVALRLADIANL